MEHHCEGPKADSTGSAMEPGMGSGTDSLTETLLKVTSLVPPFQATRKEYWMAHSRETEMEIETVVGILQLRVQLTETVLLVEV